MRKVIGGSLAALVLFGSAVAATPAEAYWHGGWHRGWHHGWGHGDAVVAGVAGLAVGAAIAGSAHPHHYYGGPRYYGAYPGYYGPACWTEWRWDPWYGNVPVRICR